MTGPSRQRRPPAPRRERQPPKDRPPNGRVGTCTCGKSSFSSKKDAKRAGRQTPTQGLNVYVCVHSGQWHLGHLPPAVRTGNIPRSAIAPRAVTTP